MCAVVGIDLGTSNSCIAVFEKGKVKIIENEGSPVTPSWVSFTDEEVLIGQEAKDNAEKNASNAIFQVKRLIGQNLSQVEEDVKKLPYEVIDDKGALKIKVRSRGEDALFSPEEVSAFVLRKLKSLLDTDILKVVVTVPAYFNETQRQATRDAAVIAGFEELSIHIINEPTAAALAFNHENSKKYRRNVVVYDFGGGTFDVTVATVKEGKCVVKATAGDLHLGGTDIDFNLVQHLRQLFLEQYGEEASEGLEEALRLRNICEERKKRLSKDRFVIDFELSSFSGRDFFATVTKEKFDDINSDIFARTLTITDRCLESAGLTKDKIDEAILVGGSSRIAKIQEMLAEYFGEGKINKTVNPDHAVAVGAAIHAANLAGDHSEIEDVVSLSLGIAVRDPRSTLPDLSHKLIKKNTPIPKTVIQCFPLSEGQTSVAIIVHQGEETFAEDNTELGMFCLNDLTTDESGRAAIDVCFKMDDEGILTVTASEVEGCKTDTIKIDAKKKGLTHEQVLERRADMEKIFQKKSVRKELQEAQYKIEKLCYGILGEDNTSGAEECKRRLRDTIFRATGDNASNIEECRRILERLETTSNTEQLNTLLQELKK